MSQTGTAVFNWFFRSRQSNRITIVQIPNLPLLVFFIASFAHQLPSIGPTARTILANGAAGARLFWAGDEVVRGANPWRRVLGGGVLLIQFAHIMSH